MIERSNKRMSMRALIVDDELGLATAEGRAARALVEELKGRAIEVVEAASAEDGTSAISADTAIHAVLVDWSLGTDKSHANARKFLEFIRGRNDKIPIFLMAERGEATSIPIDVMEMVDEFIWTIEDTAAFVGGRVLAAIRRYLEVLLPPLALALMKFNQENEYSWHTPGHTGGTAFLKSPIGRIFFDYYGENLLRSDLSISVGSLGSLLDHTGPIGEHEKYAARVFGAHRTYCVTNGTSMSNRVIFLAAVARDQVAFCDRNCHKSIEHSLVMSGGIPTYLVPLRNRYGIIGPIPPERLTKKALAAATKKNPLVTKGIDPRAVYAVVTNSTYDGLCYNARRVEELARSLGRSHSLRRGVVRVRALQSFVRGSACHAWRPEGPQGPDRVRDAFDAQAARGVVAGVAAAHSRRPWCDSAFALQRVIHDASVDVAAVSDHRLERHHDRDDGWAGRPDVDRRIDPRGRGVPADHGPCPPRVQREEGVVLQDLEPGHRQAEVR